jgi:hypothetical protein
MYHQTCLIQQECSIWNENQTDDNHPLGEAHLDPQNDQNYGALNTYNLEITN